MSHFTSHVESEPVFRTVSVAQPSLLAVSVTTPEPKSPTAAQLFSLQHSSLSAPVLSHVSVAHSEAVAEESATEPSAHVIVEHAALALQHSSLSAPVFSHVSVAHSEASAELSATEPSAHVIVEHAARASHVGNPVAAAPAAASDAHVTVAVCAT